MIEENVVFAPGDFRMTAKTLFGLEEILISELRRIGAKDIEKHNRAVSFTGDKGFMYKANLCLRTALRILVPIKSFKVSDEQSLYNEIKNIDWEQYMSVDDTLAIDCALNSDLFNHSQFLSQKAKDAIVDQFREKHEKRPSVDLDHPSLRINLFIYKDNCTVSLDSSGESLHKRGYRDKTNLAPLNEVLAAGMVLLSGWDAHFNLVDPMCGSGTILIEAALIANNIPPGFYREEFGFERWKDFDAELWKLIFDASINKISNLESKLLGADISRNVARKAFDNVKEAKVDDVVTIKTSAFENLEAPQGKGTVIINPPYGQRMNLEDINALYKSIGDTLKKNWSGYDAWLITSNMEAVKHIGLRPSRKIALFNGPLECRFLKFEMYSGTKRTHKFAAKEGEEKTEEKTEEKNNAAE